MLCVDSPTYRAGLAVAEQNVSTRDWTLIGPGALTAAIGLYYCLAGIGFFAPLQKANGPGWLGLLVGLVFLAGGLAVMLRGAVRADDKSGELPSSAPKWAAAVYWLLGMLVAAGLAGTGTWVAFGSGSRHFMMMGPIAGPIGETVGRTAFGIGAIISWLMVVAMARAGAKKIFGKNS
jgi:hypothetical protein